MPDTDYLRSRYDPKAVLVLGTDDVASAVGHALAVAGIRTLLVRDLGLPVLRRGMSFDDAVEQGFAELDGVTAYAADTAMVLGSVTSLRVTAQHHAALIDPAVIEGVIDARMRHDPKQDLRGPLAFAIGIGPGFIAGDNVDLAIESAPEATGRIVRNSETIPPHGKAAPLAGAGRERFARAPRPGLWWSHRLIGEAIDAGAVVGLCAGTQIRAPLGGRLLGLIRPGSEAEAGMRLAEVDPRIRAQCNGISRRAAVIARATLQALRQLRDPSLFGKEQRPRKAAQQEAGAWHR
jgi:hypothetical protein